MLLDKFKSVATQRPYIFGPIAICISSLLYISKLPNNWAYYWDPTYAYLFNGLAVLVGHPPNLIQHPGISMEYYLAACVFLVTIFKGRLDFIDSVIRDPEGYLHVIAFANSLVFLFSLLYLSSVIYRKFGISSVTVLHLSFLGCVNLYLPYILLAMPEFLVLVLAILCFAITVDKSGLGKSELLSNKLLFILGTCLALGVTAKVIFLPVILFVVISIGAGNRLRLMFFLLVSVLVLLIRVVDRIHEMFNWFLGASKSPQRYDADPGFNVSSLFQNYANSVQVIHNELNFLFYFFLFSAFALLLLIFLKKPLLCTKRFFYGVFLALCMTLATGYKAGLGRDFVLLSIILPLLVSVLVVYLRQVKYGKLLELGIFLLLSFGIFHNIEVAKFAMSNNVLIANAAQKDINSVNGLVGESWLIGQYGVLSDSAAVQFGNDWAGSLFGRNISKVYQNRIEYNVWDFNFYYNSPNGVLTILNCGELTTLTSKEELYAIVLKYDFPVRMRTLSKGLYFSKDVSMLYSDRFDFEKYSIFKISSIICQVK